MITAMEQIANTNECIAKIARKQPADRITVDNLSYILFERYNKIECIDDVAVLGKIQEIKESGNEFLFAWKDMYNYNLYIMVDGKLQTFCMYDVKSVLNNFYTKEYQLSQLYKVIHMLKMQGCVVPGIYEKANIISDLLLYEEHITDVKLPLNITTPGEFLFATHRGNILTATFMNVVEGEIKIMNVCINE